MDEKTMERISAQIQQPIQNLEGADAELLILHAAFEVSCTIGVMEGRTLQEQKELVRVRFEQFLEGNPKVVQILNRRPA